MHQSQEHKLDRFTYKDSNFLGEGSYGKVYKGVDTNTKREVAIKILDMSLFTDKFMLDALKTEIQVMKELKSDFVVQMMDVFGNDQQTVIVIELCNGGDLRNFIEKHGGMLDEAVAVSVLTQLMKGFKEMVDHGYIHRDIKPENSLVHNDVHKVADFGFATKADITAKQLLRECVGTPLYMAPQLLQRQPYTAKSDIWSIGVMAYEMVYGRQPWPCRDCNSYLRNMMNMPLKFPYQKEVSEEYKDFVRSCLVIDENQRIGWDRVFSHPILFKDMREKQYVQENLDDRTTQILREMQQSVQSRNLNLNQIFEEFDKDKGGQLDKQEFYKMLSQIDHKITQSEANHLFRQFDKDKDDNLSFEEFKRIFCNYDFQDLNDSVGRLITDLREIIKANNLKLNDIFKNFDKDGQGTLDTQEFEKLLRVIAPALKPNDVQKVFKVFDKNGDGQIDYQEFKRELAAGIPEQDSQYNPKREKALKILSELQRIVKSYNVDSAQIFANFDKNQNKGLDIQEFLKLCQVIDNHISPEEAQLVFSIVDANSDGNILLEEFKKLFI